MFNLLRLCLVLTVCLSWQMVMGATAPISVAFSNTPEYTKGQVLTESTKIDLKKGDELTLVASLDKKTQWFFTFDGPYSESKLANNLGNQQDGNGGIIKTITDIFGTERSGNHEFSNTSKDPWLLVVSEDDTFCYDPNISLKFRRPTSQEEMKVVITEMTTMVESPEIIWKVGKNTLDLSINKLPKGNGTTYLVEFGKQYSANLYKIPENSLLSNTSKWVWMMSKGCERQADKLISKKRVASQ